ncbi:MAG: UbiA family prenyltransferase [Bdellovibrionales bacterium]|nr:UbiA family prenyltransferase [Bdellovibrionales bacterium]
METVVTETQRVTDSPVLCVDLDGTLLRSDTLFESLLRLIKQNPLALILIPFWLLTKGREGLKDELARRVELAPESLPFHDEVVAFLQAESEAGRKLALVTASHEKYANSIADHFGFFDEVFATNRERNLKGRRKQAFLVEQFGEKAYDYMGDSRADFPVWETCRCALLVEGGSASVPYVEKQFNVERRFSHKRNPFLLFRALRIHQWVKNLLLFLPLIMAHRVEESHLFLQAVVGFFAFSFCASSVYIINDLFDLTSDRSHPKKRHRPFASGELSLVTGGFLAIGLLAVAFALAFALPKAFLLILSTYFLITLSYSIVLKRIEVLDIIVLASLYTIRVMAGGMAVDVAVSKWLLAFSMFFFLSLACIKRFSELFRLKQEGKVNEVQGRGYQLSDIDQIASFGPASGYLSVLVLALYVHSPEVKELYKNPSLLWFLCPLMLYWITRIWLLASRGKVNEDPIVFAIHDKLSYFVGAASLFVLWLAL